MSQSFTVNGKEYLQSNVLASSFGYTSDYIGKLAREEKIIGTQVGRQWFIEPESFKFFLHKSQVEKELRKVELRQLRKIEHASFQSEVHQKKVTTHSVYHSVAQACVILLCGVFVGSLSFLLFFEKIGVQEIVEGSKRVEVLLSQALLPKQHLLDAKDTVQQFLVTPNSASDVLASVAREKEEEYEIPVFTTLPIFATSTDAVAVSSEIDSTAPSSVLVLDENVVRHMSDEVSVVRDDQGRELLTPVFKKAGTSSEFFMLVPVSVDNE